jgi:hypothetical protein
METALLRKQPSHPVFRRATEPCASVRIHASAVMIASASRAGLAELLSRKVPRCCSCSKPRATMANRRSHIVLPLASALLALSAARATAQCGWSTGFSSPAGFVAEDTCVYVSTGYVIRCGNA